MTRWIAVALAAALCLSPAHAQTDLASAVAAPGRPADQVALDAGRKPAEVLAFLGLEPGDTAADVMAGARYYTEIMARVVGPRGKVIAYEPEQFHKGAKPAATWNALKGRAANVELKVGPFGAMDAAPGSLDFTLMHLTYHDLYWSSDEYKVPVGDPSAFLATLYAATRPGGIVGVVDHVGPAGDTRVTVDKLHRIDPAVIKADFKAAGFVLEAESPLLHVANDDIATSVFDASVRGKTDRIVYRFRKPR